ncbi:unnamed protein product [Blepharisma stoltei]|uniref:Aminopeptidase n=1 Tax=Blepharisma stoltei TaxID=1481888 RepID=A0AAU9K1F2_9CILI|nr:unnamed protein product [Blepharisma stoltei]
METYMLTLLDANIRAETISELSYDITLLLTENSGFSGILKAEFFCQSTKNRIFLDFHGKEVHSLSINNARQKSFIYKNSQIDLNDLVIGRNFVEVEFENEYSHDGTGLQQYRDKEDQEVYVYSTCSPFAANRIFPCFDQPNLKASFSLSVFAPPSWKVIANEKHSRIIPIPRIPFSSPLSLHIFHKTPKISTYLFAVCAGPYSEFRNDNNELSLDLGFYCRKSISSYFDSTTFFNWTIKSLAFFNEFFDYKCPFSKYDQVFIPEFKWTAMENVGCVTFLEWIMWWNSQIGKSQNLGVFLHEMSHVWFGNVVTMKWWNDLWLKESFATFLSFLVKDTIFCEEFPDTWIEFFINKKRGYAIDELSTTHPISSIIENTNQAETNFDGISYNKSSAILKQLYFLVGKEVFAESLKSYIKKYQFSNADFQDLIDIIIEQALDSDISIQDWAEDWIKTAGVNELEPIISRDESRKIVNFIVKQTPGLLEFPTLRYHKINVEFFDSSMNSIQKFTINVLPQLETVFDQFNGIEAHCAILNVDDWGYCKVIIDEFSMKSLKKHFSSISNPLTRLIIYKALWDMVTDIKLSAVEFIECFIAAQIPLETNLYVLDYAFNIATQAMNFIPSEALKEQVMHEIFNIIVNKIENSVNDEELFLFKNMSYQFLYAKSDIERCLNWLKNNATDVKNWELECYERWNILRAYSAINVNAEAFILEETNINKSSSGHFAKLFCDAAYPDIGKKEAAWNMLINNGEKLSSKERLEFMKGFNISRQKDVLSPFIDTFFSSLRSIVIEAGPEFSRAFCQYMLPSSRNAEDIIEKIEIAIENMPEERLDIKRILRESADKYQKYKIGRNLSQEYLDKKLRVRI